MDTQKGIVPTENDFALVRKLVKKLKVKKGKLRTNEDDINMLFKGIPSVIDSLEDEETRVFEESEMKSLEKSSVRKKCKKKSLKQELDVEMMISEPVIGVSETVKSRDAEAALEKVTRKVTASEGITKYVAPHLRSLLRNESEEYAKIHRRVRGLLNRQYESNVEAITREISSIFHYVARSIGY